MHFLWPKLSLEALDKGLIYMDNGNNKNTHFSIVTEKLRNIFLGLQLFPFTCLRIVFKTSTKSSYSDEHKYGVCCLHCCEMNLLCLEHIFVSVKYVLVVFITIFYLG